MKEEMAFSPSKSSSPPPPLRRRRTRSTSISTASSSSSSSSSLLSTPSPSQTPFHPSSSAVPFSWEHLPGIPKIPPANHHKTLTLIPPPSRSRTFPSRAHRRSDPKLVSVDVDPFAAALAECSKDSPAEPDFWRISRPVGSGPDRRRWSIAERLGFLDLYGSCKASCSVSQPGYRVLNRRS